jgi:hypothetical protein
MTVVQPIFVKLKLFRQYYFDMPYAEFHDNPTKELFAVIRLQTDEDILLTSRSYSLGQEGRTTKSVYLKYKLKFR